MYTTKVNVQLNAVSFRGTLTSALEIANLLQPTGKKVDISIGTSGVTLKVDDKMLPKNTYVFVDGEDVMIATIGAFRKFFKRIEEAGSAGNAKASQQTQPEVRAEPHQSQPEDEVEEKDEDENLNRIVEEFENGLNEVSESAYEALCALYEENPDDNRDPDGEDYHAPIITTSDRGTINVQMNGHSENEVIEALKMIDAKKYRIVIKPSEEKDDWDCPINVQIILKKKL